MNTTDINEPQTLVTNEICSCGTPFQAHRIFIFNKWITCDRFCLSCTSEKKAKDDAAMEAQRLEGIKRRWSEKCPWEYRTVDEGGNTNLEQMDSRTPSWRQVMEWTHGPQGLLLRGETGTCKTRAMWRLCRKLFDQGQRFYATTGPRLEAEIRQAIGKFEEVELIDRMANHSILFIDDFGKGATTDVIQSATFAIIDERVSRGRPMLITTNDSGETLAARMSADRGAPMIRRLREHCKSITFKFPA